MMDGWMDGISFIENKVNKNVQKRQTFFLGLLKFFHRSKRIDQSMDGWMMTLEKTSFPQRTLKRSQAGRVYEF